MNDVVRKNRGSTAERPIYTEIVGGSVTFGDVYADVAGVESRLDDVNTNLGTDGATPPSIAGTGLRGWLRAIYESLAAGIGRTWALASGTDSVTVFQGEVFDVDTGLVQPTTPADTQPVSGTVSVNNFPAQTGLTDTQLRAAPVDAKGPGTWAPYGAGTLTAAGSVSATGMCTGIRVLNSGLTTASYKINGGATITIPSGFVENISPEGSLVDPVVSWVSGTLNVLVTVDS